MLQPERWLNPIGVGVPDWKCLKMRPMIRVRRSIGRLSSGLKGCDSVAWPKKNNYLSLEYNYFVMDSMIIYENENSKLAQNMTRFYSDSYMNQRPDDQTESFEHFALYHIINCILNSLSKLSEITNNKILKIFLKNRETIFQLNK